ncbi:MAG TPA: right-handed parallel beta-helix repeat-containing protein [Isosphaeraceae bacterium]|jgi:parallel beta-helix repeat protein
MNRLTSGLKLFLSSRPANHDDAGRRKSARRARPTVDALEGRTVLSTVTLTVTSPSDNFPNVDPNSLRGVIQQADAVPAGTNVVIDFDVNGGGYAGTLLSVPLPAITRPVTIDGTSQPLYKGGPAAGGANYVIDGSAISAGDGLDFTAGASGSVVEGLFVVGFRAGAGLHFSNASNIQLLGDNVGFQQNAAALWVEPNRVGVEFDGGSNETIRNDTIAGNSLDGLQLLGTSNSLVASSMIGIDPYGAYPTDSYGNALGNGGRNHYGTGLNINNGSGNTVTNNVISNNGTYGLLLAGPAASGNRITANEIGTNVTGAVPRPNSTGIRIAAGANNNVVSGGNVIGGNSWDGVEVDGQGTVQNELIGNWIGTSPNTQVGIPNWNGIQLIGGSAYTFVINNTISGNSGDGVFLEQTQYDVVEQNQIGPGLYGSPLGNGFYGIILVDGASYNTIYANNIQYNRSAGLATFGTGWGNGYYYNTVVNNGGGDIIWD